MKLGMGILLLAELRKAPPLMRSMPPKRSPFSWVIPVSYELPCATNLAQRKLTVNKEFLYNTRMEKMRAIAERDEIHNLAMNLSLLMREKEWTQKDLESASGITQATISNILREKYDPAVSVVSRLAKALRKSIDDLLSPPPQKKLRNAS